MTTPPTPYIPEAAPTPVPASVYTQPAVPTQESGLPPAEALEAEVAAEGPAPDLLPPGYVRVPLGEGAMVRALVPSRWRASHLRCLNRGDLDALATGTDDDPSGKFRPGILHDDDVSVWFDVDPTQDEITDWFEALTEAGEALGKSSGPSRSTNRTRRR